MELESGRTESSGVAPRLGWLGVAGGMSSLTLFRVNGKETCFAVGENRTEHLTECHKKSNPLSYL